MDCPEQWPELLPVLTEVGEWVDGVTLLSTHNMTADLVTLGCSQQFRVHQEVLLKDSETRHQVSGCTETDSSKEILLRCDNQSLCVYRTAVEQAPPGRCGTLVQGGGAVGC